MFVTFISNQTVVDVIVERQDIKVDTPCRIVHTELLGNYVFFTLERIGFLEIMISQG